MIDPCRFSVFIVYVTILLSLDIQIDIGHRIVNPICPQSPFLNICEITEEWYLLSCVWPYIYFSQSRSSGLNGYHSLTVVRGINPLAVFRVTRAIYPAGQACPLLPPVTEGVGNKSNPDIDCTVITKTLRSKDTWQATTLNMIMTISMSHIQVGSSDIKCFMISKIRLRNPTFLWLIEREP